MTKYNLSLVELRFEKKIRKYLPYIKTQEMFSLIRFKLLKNLLYLMTKLSSNIWEIKVTVIFLISVQCFIISYIILKICVICKI